MDDRVEPGLLHVQKSLIRTECRERRASMTTAEMRTFSNAICDRIWELVNKNKHIASYLSFDNEVDLTRLHKRCWSRKKSLYFPRVVGRQEMEFAHCAGPDDMRLGHFGIREPVGPAVTVSELGVILVPGLAFDAQGGRLGFGAGFYDRALQPLAAASGSRRATLVGIGYSWQVRDEPLPMSNRDVVLDLVLTEDGVAT